MEPTVTVLFCEDVRHEIGGKVSLMGILGETIFVEKFPVTLQKICSHFVFEMHRSQFPKTRLSVKLFINGAEKEGVDLPAEMLENAPPSEHGMVRIMGSIDMLNLQITEPTELAVSVLLDDKKFSTPFTSLNIQESSGTDKSINFE